MEAYHDIAGRIDRFENVKEQRFRDISNTTALRTKQSAESVRSR